MAELSFYEAAGVTEDDFQAEANEEALRRMLARDWATTRYSEVQVESDPRLLAALEPVRLSEVVSEDLHFRVQDLLVSGGNALVWAQAKVGKTTLLANLLRSLTVADARFLGHWHVTPVAEDRTVAVLNYEMIPSQFSGWCADHGVDAERVQVWNLRGLPNPLASGYARDLLAEKLAKTGAEVLLVDTYAKAMFADDENDNPKARQWFTVLDELKAAAGITEAVVTHHAGHDGGRVRGASSLRDTPDCLIGLTKLEVDGTVRRYIQAEGRGVEPELTPTALVYEPATRTVCLGTGSKALDAASAAKSKAEATDGKQAIVRAERVNMAVEIARQVGPAGLVSGTLFDRVEDALSTGRISSDGRRRLLSTLETMPGVSVVNGPRRARVVRVSS